MGRSFYTWHVTFADHPSAHHLASDYAPMLATVPMLDPIPVRWLHLTTQGVGFTDEVDRGDLDRVISAVQTRCADLEPFTMKLGPARIDPEAFFLPVRPVEPLIALRHAIREAIGDVWGQDRVPEPADGFRPHVSLGYSNSTGPAEPLTTALAAHTEYTAKVVVSSVSLIDLNRDRKAYEWTDVATVPLRSSQRRW
jgi:2'-5' RNA ligase